MDLFTYASSADFSTGRPLYCPHPEQTRWEIVVSPQYEQTLVAFSWSALWLRRILFFDFDVLRFGCAIGYLLCFILVLKIAISELRLHNSIIYYGFNCLSAYLRAPKMD